MPNLLPQAGTINPFRHLLSFAIAERQPMKLARTIFIILILTASWLTPPSIFSQNVGPSKKMGLRILYAGNLGSPREKEFVDFLSKYFTEVKTVALLKFTGKNASGFDVAILDYDDVFQAEIDKAFIANLSKDYSRPTLTIGVTGANICGMLKLKTGYL
jgi:hypothetical protein